MTLEPPDPVVLAPYDGAWIEAFESVRTEIMGTLRGFAILGVEHIGSTSVPGLVSTPVLDAVVEVDALDAVDAEWIRRMEGIGFEYVPEFELKIPERRYFQRPAAAGRLRCHAHVEVPMTEPWIHHIFFRDALRRDATLRREYAALKRTLAAEYRDDRDAYTYGKAAFIRDAIEREIRPRSKRHGEDSTRP